MGGEEIKIGPASEAIVQTLTESGDVGLGFFVRSQIVDGASIANLALRNTVADGPMKRGGMGKIGKNGKDWNPALPREEGNPASVTFSDFWWKFSGLGDFGEH